MLEGLKEGLKEALKKIIGSTTVDEQAIKEFVRDVQRSLLQADVNFKLVLQLSSRIEKRALDERLPLGLSRKDSIVKILYEEFSQIMGGEEARFEPSAKENFIILLMGIQGSGKTTVTGKLARYLLKRGHRIGVVCADTFRPGALTQLTMISKPMGVEVYGEEGSTDPVGVAKRGVREFISLGKNAIIVDTAGRHKEEKSLLEEMSLISQAINPDFAFLIIDGTIGQQCYAQSEAFHKAVPVGGLIVTKLDGTAKGGGALAAAAATGAKIYFVGTGERIDDFEAFSPTRFVGRLLGLGDIKALLERAKELELEADETRMRRMVAGKITINDFYYQLEQVKKMGSLRKILELIPGFSGAIPSENIEEMEGKMEVWKSVIQSMTREERDDPDVIDGSRTRRIARGSGVSDKEVKDLLTKFRQSKALLKASKGKVLRQLMRKAVIQEA